MIRLYQCGDPIEAQGILDYLLSNGIDANIQNAYAGGALGEIPFTQTGPEIWLNENSDYEKAHRLLREFQSENHKRAALADKTRRCQHCNAVNPASFDSCWSCLTPFADN